MKLSFAGLCIGVMMLATRTMVGQSTAIVTTAPVVVYAAADSTSRKLATVPKGELVSKGPCVEQWCAIAYQQYLGFGMLRDSLRVQNPVGPGYTNSRGAHVPSPRKAEAPPAGATAKCRDGTYSFSASRRGTCSRHGGVAIWM